MRFLIVDSETTGLEDADEPISIGALLCQLTEFRDGEVLETYYSEQEPSRPISLDAEMTHGLCEEQLRGKNFELATFLRLVESADVLIAHNARFDARMLCKVRSLFSAGDDEKMKGRRLTIKEHQDITGFSYSLKDSGDVDAVASGAKCHLWVVYKQDSPLLQMYRKNLGSKLHTFPVLVELYYYSVKLRKMQSASVEAVGLLHRSNDGSCAPVTSHRRGQ